MWSWYILEPIYYQYKDWIIRLMGEHSGALMTNQKRNHESLSVWRARRDDASKEEFVELAVNLMGGTWWSMKNSRMHFRYFTLFTWVATGTVNRTSSMGEGLGVRGQGWEVELPRESVKEEELFKSPDFTSSAASQWVSDGLSDFTPSYSWVSLWKLSNCLSNVT